MPPNYNAPLPQSEATLSEGLLSGEVGDFLDHFLFVKTPCMSLYTLASNGFIACDFEEEKNWWRLEKFCTRDLNKLARPEKNLPVNFVAGGPKAPGIFFSGWDPKSVPNIGAIVVTNCWR